MAKEKLEELIQKLNNILSEVDPSDEESKGKLQELSDAINARIESGTDEENTLSDRAKQAALMFEAKHPRIAEALHEIKVALLGIGL